MTVETAFCYLLVATVGLVGLFLLIQQVRLRRHAHPPHTTPQIPEQVHPPSRSGLRTEKLV